MTRTLGLAVTLALALGGNAARAQDSSWLDRPLVTWNIAGAAIPAAAWDDESMAALTARCAYARLDQGTAGARALAERGWLAFHLNDRQLVEGDVEVIAGLAAGDGMCRPMAFNVFVFAGGQFAGTLSPQRMGSRSDRSIGTVRLAADGTIDAQFARYAEADPLCCPSKQVTVRYRIDRSGGSPLVVPVNVRDTRP